MWALASRMMLVTWTSIAIILLIAVIEFFILCRLAAVVEHGQRPLQSSVHRLIDISIVIRANWGQLSALIQEVFASFCKFTCMHFQSCVQKTKLYLVE